MALLYKPTGTILAPKRARAVNIDDSECTFTYIEASDMDSYLKQFYAPTINMISVGEPIGTYFPDVCKYFGGFISGLKATELPPPSVLTTIPEVIEKSSMTFKDFQKAKNDGTIVLQPYYKRTAAGTKHPGITSPIGPATETYYPCSVRDSSRWVSNPCLTYDSTPIGSRQIAEYGEPSLVVYPKLLRSAAFNVKWGFDSEDPSFIVDMLDRHFRSLVPNTGLVTAAIAEANDGEFDLLTNLGEFPETVGWILGTIKDIITLWRQTRKDISKIGSVGAKALQLASQRWMEFRYAIMPLVYSVNDAIDLLKADYTEYETIRKGMDHDPIELGRDIMFPKVRERVFLKQRLFAEIDRVEAGMKMNFFNTAWELIPLSFVMDWVFNIGDVMGSIGTPSHVQQRAMQVSFQVNNATVDVFSPTIPGAYTSVNYSAYRVVPINPQSHIGFSFNPSMSWKRWADALSLSWLIFRKKS